MRFTIFANQLRRIAAEVEGTYAIQQSLHFIAGVAIGWFQLPLHQPPQVAAARFAVGLSLSVQALEQIVGN